jgi:Ca2+-binding EF-hand superfamily protein
LSTERATIDLPTQKQEDHMKHILFRATVFSAVLLCLGGLVLAQGPVEVDWKGGFHTHDKNRDGKIDRGEFQEWMVDSFFQRDTHHKGYLVFGDVKDVMSAEKFKSYDKNGEGKLRLQEFLNAAFQDFERMDVNKDGMLGIEEIENYITLSRRVMSWRIVGPGKSSFVAKQVADRCIVQHQ